MSAEHSLATGEPPPTIRRLCRYLSERSPQPMVAVEGITHVVIYLNPAFARLVGRDREDLIGRPFAEAVPEGVENGCLSLLDRVFDSGTPEILAEQEHRQAQSRPVYWSYSVWAILGDDERPVGVMIQVTDATETALFRGQSVAMNERLIVSATQQHQLAEEARSLNSRLQAFVAASSDVVYRMASDWSEMHHLLGREFIADTDDPSRNWLEKYIEPEDRPRLLEAIAEAVRTGGIFELEHRVRRVDGTLGWAFSRAVPLLDGDGSIIEWFGTASDVTEQKRAADALLASEGRYRALFNSMDEGYCVAEVLFDAGGRPIDYRFLEVNPAFERQSGLSDATGKRMSELAPGHEAHWFETFGRVAETGEPTRFDDEAQALGGRWFDVYAFRLGEPEERKVAILFSDISERKRLERSLGHRVRELAEADLQKNEFLAMLAHELRNPLSAITSAVRLARRIRLDDDLPHAHEVIERQAGNLSRMIDDLLDVSRITQGKVELKREVVDVPALIGRATEGVRPLIVQRRHELTVQLGGGPMHVDADPTRLEQVVGNLLTNAAKYTEEGGTITVSARKQGGEVVIAVKDTGVGISKEMLPKVFELFTQVDRSLERSEGGLGIGLSLVRRLVEMHGGIVAAASKVGHGSTFTVRLPLVEAAAEEAEPSRAAEVSGAGRRVLIVDDNADTARMTGRLLKSLGFEVRLCHDGSTGIEAAREFRPEVVLLDIGLPGLNGFEVAQTLRGEACCGDSLIIGISGYGDQQAREKARVAGFDHYLVKPVDIEAVTQLVSRPRHP